MVIKFRFQENNEILGGFFGEIAGTFVSVHHFSGFTNLLSLYPHLLPVCYRSFSKPWSIKGMVVNPETHLSLSSLGW